MINSQIMIAEVKNFLLTLQQKILSQFKLFDPEMRVSENIWHSALGRGCAYSLSSDLYIEKGGINFSHISSNHLPPAATHKRPDLIGCTYQALGISIVIHPLNPFMPTSHANLRFFCAEKADQTCVWWFGGGFDLTPYYGFNEDCYYWHAMAKKACNPFGPEVYFRLKNACDEYFYLQHRQESRGIGGLFFDDLNEWGFNDCSAFVASIGDCYLEAYKTILMRRKDYLYSDREKQFQLYRRGRYVEFNLLYDRGTLFGLQSGGNPELILMSLPPQVTWPSQWHFEPNSAEEKLINYYLIPRDWLAD